MKLIIEDDEGRKTVVPFVREEITIGRQEGNTIRLTERNVSRRHARLVRQNGHVLVEDLGSYNGIRINGERITGQTPVQDGDLIQIGDYDLAIQTENARAKDQGPDITPMLARRIALDEPETESDAPVVKPEVDPEDDAAPAAKGDATTRRQSTSIIRASQVEAERTTRQVVDLDPEEAPRLVVLNTPYAGREITCTRTEIRIGRTNDNDIAIDHRSLSRTHAKVVREDNGEWRVIDMQSANGLRVNGEPYAQATLRGGDVIELGHVKFKFLGPGETFRFVPGAYDEPAPRSNRVPIAVGLVVLVLAIAALALPPVRAAIGLGKSESKPPVPPSTPAPKPEERKQEVTQAGQPEPPPRKQPAPSPSAPEVQVPGLEEKLRSAQAAIAAKDFERAVDVLEPIQSADGTRPKEVEALLTQARLESTARKNIGLAQKEISGGRLEQAQTLLAQAEGTIAYAKEHEQAMTRLEAALARGSRRNRTERHNLSPTEQAQKLFEEGTSLYKKKQFREATNAFTKCLEFDEKFARCHMMLGSTYATLRDPDRGAQHYRMFIKLAPDDPKAPSVRRLLEQYERH